MSVKPAMHVNVFSDLSWEVRDYGERGFVVAELCEALLLYFPTSLEEDVAQTLRELAEAIENLPEARAELETLD